MEKDSYKVLVLHYSQTGQLTRVLESMLAPLEQAAPVEVTWQRLEPAEPYPFPWPVLRFMEEFPEAVQLDPPPLAPLDVDPTTDYDLIVLGYTVWFLSPAPPMTAFLQSATARELLRDKPVITVTACRNMWLTAQQTMRDLLAGLGARLCDHVAFVDGGPSLATFITTPRWLLTGNKGPWAGLPAAGIDDNDIQRRGTRLGRALRQALLAGEVTGKEPVLHGLEAVQVDEGLAMSERIGSRSFAIWSRLLRAAGPRGSLRRRLVLFIYVVFLLAMIITVVPLSLLIRRLLRPLPAQRLARLRAFHEQPSGSGRARVEEFDS